VSPELARGTRLLDRYTILDRVGSGGMATIYRANDGRLDRVVCVKLLRLVLDGAEGGEDHGVYRASYAHFLKEALALSKLQHPNTLRIYDFGYLADGRPFQISEFLDGGNLDTQVRERGPFCKEEMLAVLERIAGAVAEAHGHNIVHRDIKPSNILFSRVGDVLMPKLADFGIAQSKLRKRTDDDDSDDAEPTDLISTVALFSPRWAAPEQLAGGEEGPATDVYAMGLVTAFMFSGRAPFGDADPRVHFGDRIRGDAFVTRRLGELGIPDDAVPPLLAALHADPAARPASPIAFFDALRGAIGVAATQALPGSFRRALESITLVADGHADDAVDRAAPDDPPRVPPPERSVTVGARRVRLVDMRERLDFTVQRGDFELRFRVSFLPRTRDGFAIHVKGLSCFVAREERRPTSAIVASGDATATFLSARGEALGSLAWSFGDPHADSGRAFAIEGGILMVPYAEASQAVALDLGEGREVIVMCRRP
jgi:serine/threonine-protein kinase